MIARNADRQGHHLVVPLQQPFADGVSQIRGSFYPTIPAIVHIFVQKLEKHLTSAAISHVKEGSKVIPESSFH